MTKSIPSNLLNKKEQKKLGYMIPVMQARLKVWVSIHTIHFQEMLIFTYITLSVAVGRQLTITLLKFHLKTTDC